LTLHVDWIILCRYCEVNAGLATIAGGGVDTFKVAELPSPVGFQSVVRIVGDADKDTHSLTVAIEAPDLTPADAPLEATFQLGDPPPGFPAGWQSHVLVPFNTVFQATQAGPYMLNVLVDGRSESIPFRVLEGPPDA
jgi:hypothetical protein